MKIDKFQKFCDVYRRWRPRQFARVFKMPRLGGCQSLIPGTVLEATVSNCTRPGLRKVEGVKAKVEVGSSWQLQCHTCRCFQISEIQIWKSTVSQCASLLVKRDDHAVWNCCREWCLVPFTLSLEYMRDHFWGSCPFFSPFLSIVPWDCRQSANYDTYNTCLQELVPRTLRPFLMFVETTFSDIKRQTSKDFHTNVGPIEPLHLHDRAKVDAWFHENFVHKEAELQDSLGLVKWQQPSLGECIEATLRIRNMCCIMFHHSLALELKTWGGLHLAFPFRPSFVLNITHPKKHVQLDH